MRFNLIESLYKRDPSIVSNHLNWFDGGECCIQWNGVMDNRHSVLYSGQHFLQRCVCLRDIEHMTENMGQHPFKWRGPHKITQFLLGCTCPWEILGSWDIKTGKCTDDWKINLCRKSIVIQPKQEGLASPQNYIWHPEKLLITHFQWNWCQWDFWRYLPVPVEKLSISNPLTWGNLYHGDLFMIVAITTMS